MQTHGVDPRDVTWEDDRPVYRVYFWGHGPATADVPPEQVGYSCREHRVMDADDVHEVLAWADREARGHETFTLYVERTERQGTGLIRLAGADPTAG